MKKISKEAVLYIHIEGTEYQCCDCTLFHPSRTFCSVHQPRFIILGIGSCGLFYHGRPAGKGSGYLTPTQSGYAESKEGFSCKRCRRFIHDRMDCRHVDKNSAGDDPGRIHPNACCNDWKPGLKDQVKRALNYFRVRLLKK
jgi:hypothetical protein